MKTNTDIVMAFIDAWNRMDWNGVIDLLTEDVFYHNIPMQPLVGKETVRAFIGGMNVQSVNWEVLSIAENGNKVLTERVDNFVMGNGKQVSVPVMGTFEIRDGRIAAWRDYFDLATFTGQMS